MFHLKIFLLLCISFLLAAAGSAQTSAFTYQGLLKSGGAPVTSSTQLRFQLWDSLSGGAQVGTDVIQTVNPDNGLFTAVLDFGAAVFNGSPRYLDIAVISSAGDTEMVPRLRLQTVPYALRAVNAQSLDLPFTGSGARSMLSHAILEIVNTDVTGAAIHGFSGTGFGSVLSGAGLWGDASSGDGVHGTSSTGVGVYGYGLSNIGVYAKSDTGTAIHAESNGASDAVYVRNTSGSGIYVTAAGGYAIQGYSGPGFGIEGISTSNSGILAASTSGAGLSSSSNTGTGAYITSNSGLGVNVSSNSSNGGNFFGGGYDGVRGFCGSNNGNGVEGISDTGINANGVYGHSNSGAGGYFSGANYGVYGSSSAYAGYFNGKVAITGNLSVNGTLSKGGGTFKIDHPLDPANKYLYHSFVESPDMKNIYDGTITTDSKGEAWVDMPSYFEALNQDFRYQLTCIGQFAQAIVGREIASNRFQIKTDKPNVKVSWQVTGVRHDAFANAHRVVPEVDKTGDEKGKYLYPVEQNQPETQGINYEREHQLKQAPK